MSKTTRNVKGKEIRVKREKKKVDKPRYNRTKNKDGGIDESRD